MENTFKKSYSKKTNPDGSVELSFKSKRFGVGSSGGYLMIMMVALMLTTCAATYPFIPLERNDYGKLQFDKATWAFVSFPLYLVILWFISNTKDVILIKPGEGVMFKGHSLPFSDVNQFGVHSEHMGRAPAAIIFAETNGNRVKMSRSVTPELANAIKGEIYNHTVARKS